MAQIQFIPLKATVVNVCVYLLYKYKYHVMNEQIQISRKYMSFKRVGMGNQYKMFIDLKLYLTL